MVDIKQGLREMERRQHTFRRSLNNQHTEFASKIIVRKREEELSNYARKLIEDSPRKGLSERRTSDYVNHLTRNTSEYGLGQATERRGVQRYYSEEN